MQEPTTTRIAIGTMTGTSLDGLDLAAVAIGGAGLEMTVELLEHRHDPLGACGPRLRAFCEQVPHSAAEIAALAHDLGTLHAESLGDLLRTLGRPVDLVAVHGQTVFHAPPLSWALIDPAPLLQVLDCHLVTDLRTLDLARGGEGAPITPLADWVLFRGEGPRTIVNLGGFCNATHLPERTGSPQAIRGADVCACNHLLDAGARRWLQRAYDEDGTVALEGAPDPGRAERIARDLAGPAGRPRSLGSGDEGLEVVRSLDDLPDPAARLATLVAGLGTRIADAIPSGNAVLLFGGGAFNGALLRVLQDRLGSQRVRIGAPGIGVDQRESVAMAVLGTLALDGVDITLENVTGRTARLPFRAGRWFLPSSSSASEYH